jgi:hypothetical protein
MSEELNPTEAIYGFVCWLTTRDERTVISANDDVSPIVELLYRFCEANNLPGVSGQWPENLRVPGPAEGERTKSYQKQIEGEDLLIEFLGNRQNETIGEWIEKEHPLKIGDIVECPQFLQEGKKEKMVVESINVRETIHGWKWEAVGEILNPDGTRSERWGSWLSPEIKEKRK